MSIWKQYFMGICKRYSWPILWVFGKSIIWVLANAILLAFANTILWSFTNSLRTLICKHSFLGICKWPEDNSLQTVIFRSLQMANRLQMLKNGYFTFSGPFSYESFGRLCQTSFAIGPWGLFGTICRVCPCWFWKEVERLQGHENKQPTLWKPTL